LLNELTRVGRHRTIRLDAEYYRIPYVSINLTGTQIAVPRPSHEQRLSQGRSWVDGLTCQHLLPSPNAHCD